jgi:2-methylcitrate dehydratase PrpD
MSTPMIVDAPAAEIVADWARAAVFLALIDALACAFQALQQSECARLLGPLVPGATMSFGARVPGTSYQLDPVQAAFNIGVAVRWAGMNDAAFGAAGCQVADNLGAILAVADYRARKLLAEGAAPPTVSDLFDALARAHEHATSEIAQGFAHNGEGVLPLHPDRWTLAQRCGAARVASAASAASLLGGSADCAKLAAALARAEATHAVVPNAHSRDDWSLADATSRGVRLAVIAIRTRPMPSAAQVVAFDETRLTSVHAFDETRSTSMGPPLLDWQAIASDLDATRRVRERFSTSVMSHFPAVQAGKILAMFEQRASIERLPVNELVSMTVRN